MFTFALVQEITPCGTKEIKWGYSCYDGNANANFWCHVLDNILDVKF